MPKEIKHPIPLSDIAGLKPLGSLELQIMQIVWRREEAGEETTTVRHVFETLHAPDNRIAYTSIMTVAHRLRGKGWLKQVKQDNRTYHYRATSSRQDVGQESLGWVVSEFFDGDPARHVMADERSEDKRKLAVVAED